MAFLVAGLVSLSGCANYSYPPGDVAPLPSRADGLQNIEFVRKKESWMNTPDWKSWLYVVTVNGKNVHGLKNGERVRFGLESGTYTLGIRCVLHHQVTSWIRGGG